MAITQISRIQHRRGTSENLPQLAIGELGWSVDERRLFIGNGGPGSPQIENVEVLTAFSGGAGGGGGTGISSYVYKGEAAGYTVLTGPTAGTPTTRTSQRKFDDLASVRDFGATGDGTTDDTAAINRAIFELYSRETGVQTRRTLYFPAGTYKIAGAVIKIPPYAKFLGDGPESSIILQSDAGQSEVARTADNLLQTGINIGTGGAVTPRHILIDGITFQAAGDTDVFVVDQAFDVTFLNCGFKGNKISSPTTSGGSKRCVFVSSQATTQTRHIKFMNCYLTEQNFGVVIDDDAQSILFDGCHFTKLWKGVVLGETVAGSGSSVVGPFGVKVVSSLFESIANSAFQVDNPGGHTSAFNYYREVGTGLAGAGNPLAAVVLFNAGTNFSFGDIFDRNDVDDEVFARIATEDLANFAVDDEILYGSYRRGPGLQTTLTDNTAVAASTGISCTTLPNSFVDIHYTIERQIGPGTPAVRNGRIRITQNGSQQVIDDDYSENNGDVGVTFSLNYNAITTTLEYVTTNLGADAFLTYSVRKLV